MDIYFDINVAYLLISSGDVGKKKYLVRKTLLDKSIELNSGLQNKPLIRQQSHM